jgi:NAD+ kinase
MNRHAVKSLALFVDTARPAALEAARNAVAVATAREASVQMRPDQAAAVKSAEVTASPSFPGGADLMVSFGGDGTLLQAAHLAAPLDIPILGVDFGRMGFLTQLDRRDFGEGLARVLRDGVEFESRIALQASVDGMPGTFFALNEIHIDRKQHGRTLTFGIEIGGERVADIPADGIVVSSPTGSTAYFLSAGGPILAPRLEAFGIAPICPHTLFSRPLVVRSDERIRVTVPRSGPGTKLFADGREELDLPGGSVVNVVKSDRPVLFVRSNDRMFFQVLERKLHWGSSIKRSLDADTRESKNGA